MPFHHGRHVKKSFRENISILFISWNFSFLKGSSLSVFTLAEGRKGRKYPGSLTDLGVATYLPIIWRLQKPRGGGI
jgi:hypothetical protein